MDLSEEFLLTTVIKIEKLLESNQNYLTINDILHKQSNIVGFFGSKEDIDSFLKIINQQIVKFRRNKKEKRVKEDLGDFQTPTHLSDKICHYLRKRGDDPTILIEPTVGKGNFIISALQTFPNLKYIYCIDIQKDYEWILKLNLLFYSETTPIQPRIEFHCDNIFQHPLTKNIKKHITPDSKILILGNPPWITNSELSVRNSNNVPKKSNAIKNFRGIDSITGKSNFDIAEFIISDLLQKFTTDELKGKIAILCKNTVIRNIVKNNQDLSKKISKMVAIEFNTKKEFDISASASLFYANFGVEPENQCKIMHLDHPVSEKDALKFGWVASKFVSHIEDYSHYAFLDGTFPMSWRQGVKHDLTKIMVLKELEPGGSLFENGHRKMINLERERIYPFLKSSDLKKRVITSTRFQVIITQNKVGQPTDYLKADSPRLYEYLVSNLEGFNKRKSKIYRNKPPFSIFGIGNYSFKPFKIGISGFYKDLQFCLIPPINNKPVMLDDTCYLLSFDTYSEAFYMWIILNLPEVKKFIQAITFRDAKRPYTKDVLMRINFAKLIKHTNYQRVEEFYINSLVKIIRKKISEAEFNRIVDQYK